MLEFGEPIREQMLSRQMLIRPMRAQYYNDMKQRFSDVTWTFNTRHATKLETTARQRVILRQYYKNARRFSHMSPNDSVDLSVGNAILVQGVRVVE